MGDLREAMRQRDGGQGLAEYVLILSLIAMVALLALGFLGGQINDFLTMVGQSI